MNALPPVPPSALSAGVPVLVAQIAEIATPSTDMPPGATPAAPPAAPLEAHPDAPLEATSSVPVSAGTLVTEPPRVPTRAWGLSLGGGGGAGFTYRYNAADGTGWTVAGSVVRIPVYQDNGLPYVLAGFKRHWILQETDRSRLYQSVGSSLMYNAFPSYGRPVTNAAGGGSQGIHTLGAGYGIQLDLAGGWKLGFEVDFGYYVTWPGSGPVQLSTMILPMPELSLLYEY